MDRIPRASRLIGEIVSAAIVGRDIKDPRVSSLCSVVDVDVSRDLRYATIRISGYLERSELEKSVKGLNAAAGFLQSRIAAKVHWKATPRLRFVVDTTIRDGQRVIETIERERGD